MILQGIRLRGTALYSLRTEEELCHITLIGIFLSEVFKEDVSSPIVIISAFPTTLRRKVLDVAAKIVRHAERSILKVATSTLEVLRFKELWTRAFQPPKIAWS